MVILKFLEDRVEHQHGKQYPPEPVSSVVAKPERKADVDESVVVQQQQQATPAVKRLIPTWTDTQWWNAAQEKKKKQQQSATNAMVAASDNGSSSGTQRNAVVTSSTGASSGKLNWAQHKPTLKDLYTAGNSAIGTDQENDFVDVETV